MRVAARLRHDDLLDAGGEVLRQVEDLQRLRDPAVEPARATTASMRARSASLWWASAIWAAMSVALPSIARCWSAAANPSDGDRRQRADRLRVRVAQHRGRARRQRPDARCLVGGRGVAVPGQEHRRWTGGHRAHGRRRRDHRGAQRRPGRRGTPAMSWRAGTIEELRRAWRPRGERCPATNLTFRRWGAIRSERSTGSGPGEPGGESRLGRARDGTVTRAEQPMRSRQLSGKSAPGLSSLLTGRSALRSGRPARRRAVRPCVERPEAAGRSRRTRARGSRATALRRRPAAPDQARPPPPAAASAMPRARAIR